MTSLLKNNTYIKAKITYVILIAMFMCCTASSRQKPENSKTGPENSDSGKVIHLPCHSLKDSIVDFGMQLLETPYVARGQSRSGFDCSGFVYYVFQHFNIRVPRSSKDYKNFGKDVQIDSVQKGDVLVFLGPTGNEIGHVGIVSSPRGKESDFMHATSGRKKQVVITSLKSKSYTRRFVKAVRVLDL